MRVLVVEQVRLVDPSVLNHARASRSRTRTRACAPHDAAEEAADDHDDPVVGPVDEALEALEGLAVHGLEALGGDERVDLVVRERLPGVPSEIVSYITHQGVPSDLYLISRTYNT